MACQTFDAKLIKDDETRKRYIAKAIERLTEERSCRFGHVALPCSGCATPDSLAKGAKGQIRQDYLVENGIEKLTDGLPRLRARV
jgi:hypothetical protein